MKDPVKKIDLTKTVKINVFLRHVAETVNQLIERVNELYDNRK